MNNPNIEINGTEARFLLKILAEAKIVGSQAFMLIQLMQKINEINVAQPE